MNDGNIQFQTEREREQDRLTQEALMADRERRLAVLAEQDRIREARAAEDAKLKRSEDGLPLGMRIVFETTATPTLKFQQNGAGVVFAEYDGAFYRDGDELLRAIFEAAKKQASK